ncbi:dockerin type I domain-containing protein [Ruminococcus flavefaciens]|uniref:dockerin type I domain-containing protein n=1 Tax=Ruminococcus flavefaciens TaxID=1265 RepID=UPI00048B2F3D|nr:dockerin type I domain-containing protein [Ruminococcus flavefaciens]
MKLFKFFAGAAAGMIAAASLSAAMSAGAAEIANVSFGDPTGDGIIDAIDASYILSLYADVSVGNGEITDELMAICDVDKDGKVNSLDASLILSYYANQSISDTEVSLETFIGELCNKAVSWWDENAKDFVLDPALSWEWGSFFDFDSPWGSFSSGSFSDEDGQEVTEEGTTPSDDDYVSKTDSRYCFWLDISKNKDFVFNDDFIEVCFRLKDNIPEKDYAVRFSTDFSTVFGNSLVPDKVIQGNIRVGGDIEPQDVSSETGFVAYGDNVSAKPGEKVRYRINLKNNPGMAAMLVWVYFDSNAMEVEEIIPSGEFAEFADTASTGEKPKN